VKIAIVHDWLSAYAGAERVLEQILYLYPRADVFALFDFLPGSERQFLEGRCIRTSFMQHLPYARQKYRQYLLLMPFAVRRLDLSGYDLVLSSSHAVIKGVRTGANQLHICYCHTPIRYAWDLRETYLKEAGLHSGVKRQLAELLLERIRKWDLKTSTGVDVFIANSRYISERIRNCYGRDSSVIYPPVDTDWFSIMGDRREDFYLTVSRFVPYKKVNIITEAFRAMPDKRLVVIGHGPDFDSLKATASPNTQLLGFQESDIVREYMQKARAFIFAADEDFGIVPVEAQACGTPVIAYGKGGAIETVIEGKTGIFFREQTAESIVAAVREFEGTRNFDPAEIRRNAERFGIQRFRKEYFQFVETATNKTG
jgi:glycosyltransferase involved in cell wall biosynthesis